MLYILAILKKLKDAFWYSCAGLKFAWCGQFAFRLEVITFCMASPVGMWMGKTVTQKAILVSVLLLILVMELLNSAIEAVVDRVGLEHHILSGCAKDLGSAAVFLSVINAFIVWGLVFVFNYLYF